MELRSPFPGMNPYLEHPGVWHDFHNSLVPALRNRIVAQLPENYVCNLEEQVFVHELPESSGQLIGRADVAVSSRSDLSTSAGTASLIVGPVQVELTSVADVERLLYLEIRDRQSRHLVTVVELLSPANKRPGKDRDQYVAKREQLLHSSVNLVEIDLLRRWPRMPAEKMPKCDYCLLVSQAERLPVAQVWPFQLSDPMPPLYIPLREADAPLKIELQSLFDEVFIAAQYARQIYESSPDPPLTAEQAKWAESLLHS
jgi:hypothetical protein